MIRKLISATFALPMLLAAHGAFAADLPAYNSSESGPAVVFLTGKTCADDCAAVETTIRAVAANNPEMPFRRATIDKDVVCIGVVAGKANIISMTCDLVSGPGLSKYVSGQVAFAKRAQPIVVAVEEADERLREAKKPFIAEAEKIGKEQQLAVASAPMGSDPQMILVPFRDRQMDVWKRMNAATEKELQAFKEAITALAVVLQENLRQTP